MNGMVDISEIRDHLKPGQLVITAETFHRSTSAKEGDLCGQCWYKGTQYTHDWLLTYAHKQYELLTPVVKELM